MKNLILLILYIGLFNPSVNSQGTNVKEFQNLPAFTNVQNNTSADVVFIHGEVYEAKLIAPPEVIDNYSFDVHNNTLYIKAREWKVLRRRKSPKVVITLPELKNLSVNGSGDVSSNNSIAGKNLQILINGSGDVNLNLNSTSVACLINGSGDVNIEGVKGVLSIHVNGSGNFTGRDLDLESAELKCYGSGDITLEGKTATLNIISNASGDIRCKNFSASTANIDSKGSGNISVFVEKSVNVTSFGSGNIHVLGDPKSKTVLKKGSGEIHFL